MRDLTLKELMEAREFGILNEDNIREQLEKMEKEKYLAMHSYEIFECSGAWWTYLPNEDKGRIAKKRKKREDLEKLIIDFYREQNENPTIEEIFNEWNERRVQLGQIKPSTKDRNDDFFKRHFKEMKTHKIKNVSTKEWATFLEEQVSMKNLTSKAYSSLKQIVFGLLKRAKIRGFIDYRLSDIEEYVDLGKNSFRRQKKANEKEVFNDIETNIILDYLIKNLDKHNLAILLMFISGLRVGEIATLKNSNIMDNYIVVESSETRYKDENVIVYKEGLAKTKESERCVALPKGCEWVCTKLRELNPNDEFVFVNNKGRMSTNCFRRRLERICKKLNIIPKSPHKIRKTYASIIIDAGVEEILTISQMGHTNIRTTRDNYHRDRIAIDNKSRILGNIEDFALIKNVI